MSEVYILCVRPSELSIYSSFPFPPAQKYNKNSKLAPYAPNLDAPSYVRHQQEEPDTT